MVKKLIECPYCGDEVSAISAHVYEKHPEMLEEHKTIMKSGETITPRQIKPEAIERTMTERIKRIEAQNELLMLQVQQNSLIRALNGSPEQTPQQNKNDVSAISEALKLISQIKDNFRVEEPAEDPQDAMMFEAMDLIKQYAQSKMMSQIPPPSPAPPTPPLDIPNINEVINKEVFEDDDNTEECQSMAGSVLHETKPNGEAPKGNKREAEPKLRLKGNEEPKLRLI